MKKNLLYYIYPLRNQEWILNIEKLNKFGNIFNGYKLVTIAEDENTVGPKLVKSNIKLRDVNYRVVRNDPHLQEVKPFFSGLRKIKEESERDSITFYAHGKGVTVPERYDDNEVISATRKWRNFMYRYCLFDELLIDYIFDSGYSCAGCFKGLAQGDLYYSNEVNWFYGGSFYWFINEKIFQQEGWDTYNKESPFATEFYPARFFGYDEAYCIIGEGSGHLRAFNKKEDWFRFY